MTLAEVKALDAGSWFGKEFAGERIPTLEEIVTLDTTVHLVIEAKHGSDVYAGISHPERSRAESRDEMRYTPAGYSSSRLRRDSN
jgi:glycerophosphoryl diester phosphodiesterase